jgi:hypothetical protein
MYKIIENAKNITTEEIFAALLRHDMSDGKSK